MNNADECPMCFSWTCGVCDHFHGKLSRVRILRDGTCARCIRCGGTDGVDQPIRHQGGTTLNAHLAIWNRFVTFNQWLFRDGNNPGGGHRAS